MTDDDRWLRDDLHRLAGSTPDEAAGLTAMRSRARSLQRRRAGFVGGIAAVAAVLAGIVATLRLGDDAAELRTADTAPAVTPTGVAASTSPTPTGVAPITSPTPTSAVVTAGEPSASSASSATDVSTAPAGSSSSAPEASSPVSTQSTAAGTTPSTVTTAGSGSTETSVGAPAPVVRTFSSLGGSVTVRLADGDLALVDYVASVGFTAEIEDDRSERVRIRFRSDSRSTRIEVRVENAVMVHEVDEGSGSPG